MLTADLADVRRSGAELELTKLDAKKRARVREIAEKVLETFSACALRTRAELEEELGCIEVGAREERLKDALIKLATDAAEWSEPDAERAEETRRAVFVAAARARREGTFDRATLLAELAGDPDAELFGDLREAHRLIKPPPMSAEQLSATWESSRAQAVLLRATKVRVALKVGDARRARDLFRAIKFLGLIHTLTKHEEGYLLEVDGPFSLFESVTKYGLKLALLVPVLESCEAYALEASVRWGKERATLTFRTSGGRGGDVALPEADTELASALTKLGWRASANTDVLELPGVGLCVPDLVIEKDGARVYVEVLGFWSRAAVWRRVELVQKGLSPKIVFAVSARLRVSEEVLDGDASAALYVYKGTISARALAAKASALVGC